jgi:phosphoribosyl-ATP pyrophosphohydrolase/phosphoribosyl-AMP cyclohydrolase
MANLDLKDVKFDPQGLVPVVAQDLTSGEVLMLAYGNAESLAETERTGELVLYSRSRKEIWHKGKTSGNRLKVAELRLDCDGDAILAIVEPLGPACHTGNWSCFYRNILGEPAGAGTFPGKLWRYLLKRKGASPRKATPPGSFQRAPRGQDKRWARREWKWP